MLGQVNLNGESKVDVAIKRLKTFEPPEGYYLAFSGGKDSQCIYHLAKMAGVKFDAHYSVTTVDPPELMKFVKENYPDVIWERPKYNGKPVSMWTLIPEHSVPPTRKVRYCCDVLKEQHGQGRVVVTGVRWAESSSRKNTHGIVDIRTQSKKIINDSLENNPAATLNTRGGLIFNDDNDESRKTVEQCYQKRRITVNPIVDWDEDEVWEFIKEVAKVPYCSLYDEGFTRLGCIGCPLQGTKGMMRDFERWPRYRDLYIRAFDEMIKRHPDITDAKGKPVPPGGAENVPNLPRLDMSGKNLERRNEYSTYGHPGEPRTFDGDRECQRRLMPRPEMKKSKEYLKWTPEENLIFWMNQSGGKGVAQELDASRHTETKIGKDAINSFEAWINGHLWVPWKETE